MNPKRWLHPTHIVYILVHALIVLVGYLLASSQDMLTKAIGASMIAGGITGYAIFVYVLFSQRVTEQLSIITEFGLIKAFDARAVRIKSEYDERLNRAHERIDVMGFGLRALREDYLNDLEDWKRKANVRILLLDPEFPDGRFSYANQRDAEERNPRGTIEIDVRQFVNDTARLLGNDASRSFEVRLYSCLPSINIFRVDDELFWGPYLMRQQSRNTPTFLVKRGGILFQRLVEQFENIWSDDTLSRPVPSDWLTKT